MINSKARIILIVFICLTAYVLYLVCDENDLRYKTDIELYSPALIEYEDAYLDLIKLNKSEFNYYDDIIKSIFEDFKNVSSDDIELELFINDNADIINEYYLGMSELRKEFKSLSSYEIIPDYYKSLEDSYLSFNLIRNIMNIYVLKCYVEKYNDSPNDIIDEFIYFIDVLIKTRNHVRSSVALLSTDTVIKISLEQLHGLILRCGDDLILRRYKAVLSNYSSAVECLKRVIMVEYCVFYRELDRMRMEDRSNILWFIYYNKNITFNQYGDYIDLVFQFINDYNNEFYKIKLEEFTIREYYFQKNMIGTEYLNMIIGGVSASAKFSINNEAKIKLYLYEIEEHLSKNN